MKYTLKKGADGREDTVFSKHFGQLVAGFFLLASPTMRSHNSIGAGESQAALFIENSPMMLK